MLLAGVLLLIALQLLIRVRVAPNPGHGVLMIIAMTIVSHASGSNKSQTCGKGARVRRCPVHSSSNH